MRTIGFIATGMAVAAALGVGLTVALSVSDIRRYLHMRKM
jgi:hypothetical protein